MPSEVVDRAVVGAVGVAHVLRHPRLATAVAVRQRALPRLGHPRRYLDLMLWRKVVDRNPRFVTCCDKLATKALLAERCPDLALPATIWVGDDIRDAPADAFVDDVYVKATHGWGWNQRVDAGTVDRRSLHATTSRWMRSVHGTHYAEWGYGQVPPKLFVEAAIGDPDGDLVELEVRAAAGRVVHSSIVGHMKRPGEWRVYVDREGGPLTDDDAAGVDALAPGLLAAHLEAVDAAERLSVDLDYARYDFFVAGGTLYGGEITVYPDAGVHDLRPAFRSRQVAAAWALGTSHAVAGSHTGWRRTYGAALGRRLAAPAGEPMRGGPAPAP